MEELLAVKETAEKLKKIVDIVKSGVEKYRKAENAKALETVAESVRDSIDSVLRDAAASDALDGYITAHADTFRKDSALFPPEYRRQIAAEFLRRSPDALPFGDATAEAVERYFDELEKALRNNLSTDSLILLRNIVTILSGLEEKAQKLNEIGRDVKDLKRGLLPEGDDRPLYRFNRQYAELFVEPLFMHPGTEVNLRHLFVPHRFEAIEVPSEPETESLDALLARFLREDLRNAAVLFIEGDAGCGKSSLAAYLNYHYQNSPTFRQEVFGDRELISVRLREISIPASGADANRLADGILAALCTDRNELRRKNAALLLDGYDELCAAENLRDTQSALRGLGTLGCKVIVTTRPEYIRFHASDSDRGFGYRYWHLRLRHFDREQRKLWLDRYTIECGETIGEINQKYLNRIDADENAPEGICDTPMGLYMVAAGHFEPGDLENEWAMYRRIFHEEQVLRNYDSGIIHNSDSVWESLYRVSEEIAFYMFRHGNENLLVPGRAVREIVESLHLEDAGKEKLVERSFALCGYWKAHTDTGCVEFYHNNIRDFFLCEKIMDELNRLYTEYESLLIDNSADITPFLKELCALFQRGETVEKRVMDFIRLRVVDTKDSGLDKCVELERVRRFLPRIFETLLTHGAPYTVLEDENPVRTVSRILANVVRVFTSLYLPLLREKETIRWWNDISKINESGILRQFANHIFSYAPNADLSGADLRGADLRWADLSEADLREAGLSRAGLQKANLRGADLSRADLSRADLSVADLRGADLSRADLSRADLDGADLWWADLSGAGLREADLSGAGLREAVLREAVLLYAHMPKAYMREANMRGADLRGADLQEAYLFGADLSEADLRRADLRGADLRMADLSGADLESVNLYGCDLSQVIGLEYARNVPEKYLHG